MAYRMLESTLCPNCGTDPREWFDEHGREIDPPPYVVVDKRCVGCVNKSRAIETVNAQNLTGVSFGFVPFDPSMMEGD